MMLHHVVESRDLDMIYLNKTVRTVYQYRYCAIGRENLSRSRRDKCKQQAFINSKYKTEGVFCAK